MSALSGKRLTGKLIYGFELLALIALVVLEYLSGYKGGLMKHIYFKRMEYMFSIYTDAGMALHSALLLLLLGITVFLVRRSGWDRFVTRCLIRLTLYGIVLMGAFYLPWFRDFVVYAYALMVIEAIIVLEMIKVASFLIHHRKRARCDTGYPLPN